jgi:hypothetical protein
MYDSLLALVEEGFPFSLIDLSNFIIDPVAGLLVGQFRNSVGRWIPRATFTQSPPLSPTPSKLEGRIPGELEVETGAESRLGCIIELCVRLIDSHW